jgi:formylmethanofuran dehydrogenase subunit D
MESSGGGGCGDPLERDPQKIEQDLREGLVTKEKAEARYGIVFKGDKVDDVKTGEQRERKRKERSYFRVQASRDEEYRGTKRLCFLTRRAMSQLGVNEGDLVELVNPRAAPLRAWVSGMEGEDEGFIYLGNIGMEILGVKEGDQIELRKFQI